MSNAEEASGVSYKTKEKGLSEANPLELFQKEEFEFPQLTLEQVFSYKTSRWNRLLSDKTVTLIAVGDVMLGRMVNSQSVSLGNFNWPFKKTNETMRDADVTLINLESPLLVNCPLTNEGMRFCGDPRHVGGLVDAGVDLVNLANNHVGDYGTEGIESSQKLLSEMGIGVVGLSGPVYKEIGNLTFAFLGYNQIHPRFSGVSWGKKGKVVSDIEEAKKLASVVIVSFHWGKEYTSRPVQKQVEFGRLAIEGGADLVIGHHPHWIQPVEVYKGKLIVYSLGNFVFDQMWSEKTRVALVGKFTFWGDQVISAEVLPIKIENLGQPTFLSGEEKERVLNEVKEASYQLLGF